MMTVSPRGPAPLRNQLLGINPADCSYFSPQAEEVLDKFLQEKDTVGKAILQNDKALTEKQREIEGEGLV